MAMKSVEEIAEFFARNDLVWHVDSVGSSHNACDEQHFVSVINDKLNPGGFYSRDIKKVIRYFTLLEMVEGDFSHEYALRLLRGLDLFGCFQKDVVTESLQSWIEAAGLFGKNLYAANRRMIEDIVELDGTTKLMATTIKKLRDMGYEIPISSTSIAPSDADQKKFAEKMQSAFSELGCKALESIQRKVDKLFVDQEDRYAFFAEPKMAEDPELQVPWGYLLNMAYANLAKAGSCEGNVDEEIEKITEQAKLFFALFEIQPFEKIKSILLPPAESLREVLSTILYQQHFAMEQYSLVEMSCILKQLEKYEEQYANAQNHRKAKAYIAILDYIESCCTNLRSTSFTVSSVAAKLTEFTGSEIIAALQDLSMPIEELNEGYALPINIRRRNYYKKPLVRTSDQYRMLNSRFFSKGFYMVWKENCSTDGHVGDSFEKMIKDRLSVHNFTFLHNCKYRIDSAKCADLHSVGKEGECDFVIESDTAVYFVELKKKEITAKSMSGRDIYALIDMSKSALAAFVQGLTHEYCLRTDGKILFKDGSSVDLKGREVVKVHLSLFDHYGLHDRMLIHHFLRAVRALSFETKEKIVGDVAANMAEFKELQIELRNLLDSKAIQNAYRGEFACLMRFLSFSAEMFMSILDSIKSIGDFDNVMNDFMHVSFGVKDQWQERAACNYIRSSGR